MILCLPACFPKKTASPYWHKSLWPISFLGPVLQGLGPHVFSRHESFAPVLFFSEDVEPWTAKKNTPQQIFSQTCWFLLQIFYTFPSSRWRTWGGRWGRSLGSEQKLLAESDRKIQRLAPTSKSGAGPAHLKTKKKTCESASRQVEVLGHVWFQRYMCWKNNWFFKLVVSKICSIHICLGDSHFNEHCVFHWVETINYIVLFRGWGYSK